MKRILFIVLTLIVVSCKKPIIEPVSNPLEFYHPSEFPETTYPLSQNPINRTKFELGRELFYSTILSLDNTISCATCHAQTHAFSDHNIALSFGIGGQVGIRNSPPIFNMAWQPHFMWDGGVNHLEVFSLAPITNPVEMNETMTNVVQ
jgi:cytochrome c peroxidase